MSAEERVARAIAEAPVYETRRNKALKGAQWEVFYIEGEIIAEDTVHIIAAFHAPDEAEQEAVHLTALAKARAAITEMNKMAEEKFAFRVPVDEEQEAIKG